MCTSKSVCQAVAVPLDRVIHHITEADAGRMQAKLATMPALLTGTSLVSHTFTRCHLTKQNEVASS